jgi:hypothetical protein
VYLLDTMILSELRKRQRDARLVAWLKDTRHFADTGVLLFNPSRP